LWQCHWLRGKRELIFIVEISGEYNIKMVGRMPMFSLKHAGVTDHVVLAVKALEGFARLKAASFTPMANVNPASAAIITK